MRLYRLGCLEGQMSMLVFHALAKIGREALVLVSPREKIVSVGYFQDADKVVDLTYCRKNGISVMRREIGGGTTLLDRNQVFFQLVIRRENPDFPKKISSLYELISGPCVDTYRRLGVDAVFRPVNDIVTREGRKVSGLGGADIGECIVFVGNVILDFDSRQMANILRVPSEKFRDKVFKSLEDNVSSVLKETGRKPWRREVEDLLIECFAKRLGLPQEACLDREIEEKARELEKEMMRDDFLFRRRRKPCSADYMKVKIAEGVQVSERSHKAPGGLITVTHIVEGDTIKDISISGDFTFYPKDSLTHMEEALLGKRKDITCIENVISGVYQDLSIQAPGVAPFDFARAVCESD